MPYFEVFRGVCALKMGRARASLNERDLGKEPEPPVTFGLRDAEAGPTFGPDGHELDALAGDEIQRLVHVVDLVHAHFAPLGLGQSLPCEGDTGGVAF